jgi:hypothetical protein
LRRSRHEFEFATVTAAGISAPEIPASHAFASKSLPEQGRAAPFSGATASIHKAFVAQSGGGLIILAVQPILV